MCPIIVYTFNIVIIECYSNPPPAVGVIIECYSNPPAVGVIIECYSNPSAVGVIIECESRQFSPTISVNVNVQ